MMLKYGRFALAESLSGTPGQVVPERAALEIPTGQAEAGGAAAAGISAATSDLPSVLVQEAEAPLPDTDALMPENPAVEAPAEPAHARSGKRTRSRRRARRRRTPAPTHIEQEAGR
jgi:hypothetical protein